MLVDPGHVAYNLVRPCPFVYTLMVILTIAPAPQLCMLYKINFVCRLQLEKEFHDSVDGAAS